MDTITIKQIEPEQIQIAAPFLFPPAREMLAKDGIILLASDANTPCGALGAVLQEDTLHVCSLFVIADYRRKGIASALLEKAEALAAQEELPGISLSYACTAEQTAELNVFFAKNGYPMPIPSNIRFTVSIADLEKSTFAKVMQSAKPSSHIHPLRSIDKALLANLPDYVIPRADAGRPLHDLCLAYVQKNTLTALLIITDTDGVLHLHSAYLPEDTYAAHLMPLLKRAFDTVQEKYPHYQTLTLTATGEQGYTLIQKLLAGAPFSQSAVYHTIKTISPLPMGALPLRFTAALARFQSFAAALAQRGISSELLMLGSAPPHLEFSSDAAEEPIGLHYEIDGFDTFTDFTLLAEYAFPPLAEPLQNKILEKVNAETEPYYGILSEDGNILFRGSFSEGGDAQGFDVEKSIDAFVLPFQSYVKELKTEFLENK